MRSSQFLEHLAYNLRVDVLRATTVAGSGHPTSALSAADLVAGLFFYALHYDVHNHQNPRNDRFILSKGHAAIVLYAVYKQLGIISDEELLSYRKFGSMLEGHPTPRFPYIEAATGSLGQGLSIGLGMSLAARLDNVPYYTYVLLGDSEMAEGSNWEAINLASHYACENLIAIVDVNRLGQSTATIEGHELTKFQAKFEAFGWRTILIDGHSMPEIMQAYDKARQADHKPTVILAKTYKGYGVDEDIEDHLGYHGKAFSKEELPKLLERLQKRFPEAAHYAPTVAEKEHLIYHPLETKKSEEKTTHVVFALPKAPYFKEEKVATRKAYGQALAALGEIDSDVISLDGEVKNSTFAEIFESKFPERFFQCFIAEQNMIGMGVGFANRHKVPFVSTFAAFLTRAHDQLRMAAIGHASLRVVGSHAGVSIGEDGPSQMGLEDLGLFRSLPRSIILYPSDAISVYKMLVLMVDYTSGISYLRTTRMPTPIMYTDKDDFVIGGCKIVRSSEQDVACIVAAGVTVFEALKAYEQLQKQGVFVRVIDCYSIKPLPVAELIDAARQSKNRLIIVEDHYREGGLGEAICYALRNQKITFECLNVKKLPMSGKPEELLADAGIDAAAIIKTVKPHN